MPYGTLLCVSDKPLHGEIKLPGQANRFYEGSISEHLQIGIQAIDLVLRKMSDGGEMAFRLLDEIMDGAKAAQGEMPDLARAVWDAAETLREATVTMIESGQTDRLAGAMPYLNAFARVLGAHYHLIAARKGDEARKRLASIFVTRVLPRNAGDLAEARAGWADLDALPDAAFAGAA